MGYKVRLTSRAVRDLEAIYAFVHAGSSEKAAAGFRKLSRSVYSLERFPEKGKMVPENERLRQLLFGKRSETYRIIYSVQKRSLLVTVLHIRHVARRR